MPYSGKKKNIKLIMQKENVKTLEFLCRMEGRLEVAEREKR